MEGLQNYDVTILRFLYDFRVTFDNSLSKLNLLTMKLKLKVTCGLRSLQGMQFLCTHLQLCNDRVQAKPNPLWALHDIFMIGVTQKGEI